MSKTTIGKKDVIHFIENCSADDKKDIMETIMVESDEDETTEDELKHLSLDSLMSLKGVTNLADSEKLELFLKHIETIDYAQLEKFCEGKIITREVA